MENRNDQIGLALALSSSVFIGSSFIIKKKGLIRARSTGHGAGDGGFAYLRESLWWIGMITMIGGEVANFLAYAYAPAILVTPLGALSVLMSAILASIMLKEGLLMNGKVGCALCLVGSTIIVLNAPAEQDVTSVNEITLRIARNIPFQAYVSFVLVASVYLIWFVADKIGKKNILVYVTICSIVGSVSVIGVKALGIALRLTVSGNNQLVVFSTWLYLFVVVVCILTQMNYLNKALDTFNTALVTPIYYVMFTTCTIFASALLFEGWTKCPPDDPTCKDTYSAAGLVTCLCGFLTICAGVFLLHSSREEALRLENDTTLMARHTMEGNHEVVPLQELKINGHHNNRDYEEETEMNGNDSVRAALLNESDA